MNILQLIDITRPLASHAVLTHHATPDTFKPEESLAALELLKRRLLERLEEVEQLTTTETHRASLPPLPLDAI